MNLQNIPAKAEYLACFKAPAGYKMVTGDYSGQELRVITEGSKDPVWVNAFMEGKDLHGEIAAMVFGIDISEVKNKPEFVFVGSTKVYLRGKSPRDVAKTINFMLAYGGTEFKLSATLGITVDEAKAIIKKYFEAVPMVKLFFDRCASYGVRNGFIRSFQPYSIIRYFTGFDKSDEKAKGEIERMSKNTPIQATAAMMTKLALCAVREVIKTLDYDVQMFMQIHDSIMTYVKEEHAEEWKETLTKLMQEAGKVFIKTVSVEVDVKISSFWEK